MGLEGLVTSTFKSVRRELAFPLCSPYPPPMRRDSMTLSDMPQPVLGIECALCQRREQFDVEARKVVQHGGDVKMPDLLGRLVADCSRRVQRSFSVHDRCRAVYDRSSRYGSPNP
jgi:hypothetical protein